MSAYEGTFESPFRPGRRLAASLGALVISAACGSPTPAPLEESAELQALRTKIARFAPVEIRADLASLPANERVALDRLVAAARLMDGLFLEQVWANNPSTLAALAADRSPEGQAELHYFLINKGPWSRLDHDEVFLRGGANVPAKPPQANFYPADASREEVERWLLVADEPTRQLATGFFSVIRREADGRLVAVPYHVQYRNTLVAAAELLRQAAASTTQPTLRRYLDLRAGAFLSNDYYESDVAWMELDASIEPTIGPYETYEDKWFGYKAAFEAFVTLRDEEETSKLRAFSSALQALEDALPIDAQYRNPRLGALAPIRVVNVVFAAGDGNRGVQTAAFNLPNDERVVREKGSKRVMLKNVQEAKFSQVLMPISKVALQAVDQNLVSFDAFFTHILMHELMHGLGPQQVHGTTQGLRLALKETYSALEEAKADISGLWALQRLADQKLVSADIARSMYTTFLTSAFRSIRFGVNEAHGKGVAVQMNYLLDKGAFRVHDDGAFSVVPDRMRSAVEALAGEIMTIQATGNYEAARTLLARLGVVRPEVQRVLDRLSTVPVDIEPRFTGVR